MKDGWIQQCSSPKEMFDKPNNMFVAGFIGTPPMNFYHGTINENGYFVHESSGIEFKLDPDMFAYIKSKGYVDKEVVMASRPDYVYMDDLSLSENPEAKFELNLEYEEHLGAYNLL